MSAYNKAIAAALGALTQLGVALSDGKVSAQEWVAVAVAALTVLAVGVVANKPQP
jgi:hypothetical protein